jgi:hypothetical protein
MDKASMSAKSYKEQKKKDKSHKSKKNIFSSGFSWVKKQFTGGSHHEEAQAIIALAPKTEIKIGSVDDELGTRKPKEQLEGSSSLYATVSHPNTRMNKRKSRAHVSFAPETIKDSVVLSPESSSSEEQVVMPVLSNMALAPEIKLPVPDEPKVLNTDSSGDISPMAPIIEPLIASPVVAPVLTVLKEMIEQQPAEAEVGLAVRPHSEAVQPDPFSSYIRRTAFEKHQRNSQRLSGQVPNYNEVEFIEGGRDVDFIRASTATGEYWPNPDMPGSRAGEIDHRIMDMPTFQRLGYEAGHGDAVALHKIEAAKIKSNF